MTSPRGLGLAVAAVGAVSVVSALTPELPLRLELVEGLVDPVVVHLADGTTALIGVVLMLLGRGLAQRRRSAYFAALGLLTVSAVLHVVKGLDVEEALLAIGVAALLVRARDLFTVPLPAGGCCGWCEWRWPWPPSTWGSASPVSPSAPHGYGCRSSPAGH